ncbi:MAG TPA: OmpA family protein [Planctomycetota bacterium]|nr:OmpA family protein [Planctomycetota bacterium]
MQGTKGVLVLLLCASVGMLVGCGEQNKYSKANFEALEEHNRRMKQQMEEQQAEMELLKRQPSTAVVTPTGPATGGTSIEDIRAQLPAGTWVEDRGGQTVIRIQGSQVTFASGKTGVTTEGRAVLDRVAGLLTSQLTSRRVIIEGHTDSDPIRKTKHLYSDNYDLGRKRAQSVADYLASRGVDRSRIDIQSYGPDRPISKDKAENRRVEVVVSAGPAY